MPKTKKIEWKVNVKNIVMLAFISHKSKSWDLKAPPSIDVTCGEMQVMWQPFRFSCYWSQGSESLLISVAVFGSWCYKQPLCKSDHPVASEVLLRYMYMFKHIGIKCLFFTVFCIWTMLSYLSVQFSHERLWG